MVAVSLFVIPAVGEDTVFGDAGTLRLQMNDTDLDRLVYDPLASGEPDLTQALSQTNCRLSTDNSLMSFVGSSSFPIKKPAAGLRDHRIGVVQLLEQHELCARIDGIIGQKLTLGLSGALAEREIGYAEIDLGFKHNGSAILELRNGGPSGAVVGTVTVTCSGPAPDCGPDSGGDDNRRVILWIDPEDNPGAGQWQAFQVAGVFDTIVIKPGSKSLKSSISLEAGFYGSPAGPLGTALGTGDTLFKIVEPFDGEIDCEATVTLGGGAATQQITRGSNTDGGCDGAKGPLAFNFESGVEGDELFVDFMIQPTGDGTMAQFLEVITWNFPSPPASGQHRTLFYDDPDPEGAERREMPWCVVDPRVEGGLPPGTPATNPLPAGHTSCLIESNSRVTTSGTFVSVDVVYNVADGRRWK
jgi:hypothetical protein